jgi:hypothetical protein
LSLSGGRGKVIAFICSITGQDEEPLAEYPNHARYPWQEVSKVKHYWLEVSAMKRPMTMREDGATYGKGTA